MRYQILFCLSSEDTGTVRNPALIPVLDAAGRRREFAGIDDAYSTLNRLLRLAAGLSYYVTPVVPGRFHVSGSHCCPGCCPGCVLILFATALQDLLL